MPTGMSTTGIKELLAKYERMGKAGLKLGKKAVKAGGTIVRDAYEANAPKGPSGRTQQGIRLRVRASQSKGAQATIGFNKQVFAGASKKARRGNPFADAIDKQFYIPWANAGHFAGKRIKGRMTTAQYRQASQQQGRKWIEGSHWIDKARDGSIGPAREAVNETLKTEIAAADAAGGNVS